CAQVGPPSPTVSATLSPEVTMDRRHFLFASGGLTLSPLVPQTRTETEAAKDVTRTLARYIVSAKPADLSAAMRKEAARTLLNWVGCAVGGSRHETVGIAVSALAPFSGPAQASILGRKERLDILNAALINGISSHVLDYDDTHTQHRASGRPGRFCDSGVERAAPNQRQRFRQRPRHWCGRGVSHREFCLS